MDHIGPVPEQPPQHTHGQTQRQKQRGGAVEWQPEAQHINDLQFDAASKGKVAATERQRPRYILRFVATRSSVDLAIEEGRLCCCSDCMGNAHMEDCWNHLRFAPCAPLRRSRSEGG